MIPYNKLMLLPAKVLHAKWCDIALYKINTSYTSISFTVSSIKCRLKSYYNYNKMKISWNIVVYDVACYKLYSISMWYVSLEDFIRPEVIAIIFLHNGLHIVPINSVIR